MSNKSTEAFNRGWDQAQEGDPYDNPYAPGTPEHEEFKDGYDQSVEAIQEEEDDNDYDDQY